MTIVILTYDDLGRSVPDDGRLDETADRPLWNMLASFKMQSKSSGIANDWKRMQTECYSGLKKWWGAGESIFACVSGRAAVTTAHDPSYFWCRQKKRAAKLFLGSIPTFSNFAGSAPMGFGVRPT